MKDKILIALDDRHGANTPGKRTPKFEDGSFMHENEFNSAVVNMLDELLRNNGFNTLLVAPTDKDTPLSERTEAANKNNADFYMSVHADAYTGEWNDANGISIFHYPESTEGKKAASIIYEYALQGTKLRGRGIKTAEFYVLRNTTMPAVLIECGFMDNKREAKLLMSYAYRNECAIEICKGICEYFGVKFKPLEDDSMDINDINVNILGNATTIKGIFIDDKNYVSIRELLEKMGYTVNWDKDNETVTVDFKLK